MAHTCKHCGKYEDREFMGSRMDTMRERQTCFSCDYWFDQLEEREHALVTKDFYHMRAAPGEKGYGCGGRKHTIHLTDGTSYESRNVWHQGTIPKHMRHLFAVNVARIEE